MPTDDPRLNSTEGKAARGPTPAPGSDAPHGREASSHQNDELFKVVASKADDGGGNGEGQDAHNRAKRSWRSLWGLPAWLKENRLWAALIVVVVIATISSGVVMSIVAERAANRDDMHQAMEALDAGDLITAREVAKRIAMKPRKTTRDLANSSFILGMAAADDAKAGWNSMKDELDEHASYLLAARYFDIAYPSGFPARFELLGLKTYGDVLLHCHRFAESRKVLEKALKIAKDTPEKNAVRYLLVENDLAAENPDLTEATRLNKAYLDTKDLSKRKRTEGLLQRLQIETNQKEFAAARATLASIPQTPAYIEKFHYAKGRLEMREAEEEMAEARRPEKAIRDQFNQAIDSFRRAQGNADESSATIPRSKYLIGICYEQLHENRAALQQWQEVCKLFPHSPEAVGSQYRMGNLFFHEEASDPIPVQAVECFREVTLALEKEGNSNPWVTATELRENAIGLIKDFRKKENFGAALALTEAIAPLLPKLQAMGSLASLHQERAQQILDTLNLDEGSETVTRKQNEALRHFREASLLFTELAKLEKTSKNYSEDLWQSAECALKGCDFDGAVRAFIRYLNVEPERRNAASLLGLGKAYLSLGEVDEAIDTLEQCIEFYPANLATFQSRLLAAEAWLDKGDPKQAERLLLENWSATGITPESIIWRETLYRLGQLYHDTQRYDEAIQRLEDAVRRFPDNPQTNLTRYLLADSYRLRADAAQLRIEKTMTRSKLSAQKANIESDLRAAYHQYTMLLQQIGSQRGMGEISEMDHRLLRNSRLFAAGVLLQLGQYEQAAKAYSTASLHYQGQPISIQTMQQNAQALVSLGQNREAQSLLRRALSQLEKMGPDLPYEETTLYGFSEWKTLLQRMEKEVAMKQTRLE